MHQRAIAGYGYVDPRLPPDGYNAPPPSNNFSNNSFNTSREALLATKKNIKRQRKEEKRIQKLKTQQDKLIDLSKHSVRRFTMSSSEDDDDDVDDPFSNVNNF